MHRLLKRQLKRIFADRPLSPDLEPLLRAVSATYEQNDSDRDMIERSLQIMSRELTEQNRQLTAELEERRNAEARLERSLAVLGATLSSTNDGILIVGSDRRVESYNDKFVAMWRIPPKMAERRDDRELLTFATAQLADPEGFVNNVEAVLNSSEETFGLVELADGRTFECFSRPHWIGTEMDGRIWSFRDVTERRKVEQRLLYLANYDELTGLANRNLLLDRLSQAIASAHRHGDMIAVLHIDIDHLKVVNDGLGLRIGDQLISIIGRRLQAYVRQNDTVARIGSDEFVIILNDLSGHGIASQPLIAEALQRILAAAAKPIYVDGRELNITCSIGASLYPQDGQDAETLLRNAAAGLNRAKELGRNNAQFYTAEMNERMHERLRMQELLRHAIAREEFALHYQPKLTLDGTVVCGVEALLRWNCKELGPVGPDRFIPVLEQSGMIVDVGRWVLAKAVADQRAWRATGLPVPRIAVNLSQIQLNQPNFVEVIESVLGDASWSAEIDLEITESLIMENVESNISKLKAVKAMGLGIAIDDFGTGYSSLSHLKKLPVSTLKIDRAFIMNLAANTDDFVIVSAMISLAHSLKLSVVAEGVETEEQAALLRQLGCDEIQGYLISRPLPRDAFWQWYAARTSALAEAPRAARRA